MKTKLLTEYGFFRIKKDFWLTPSICFWYDKETFLETGVYTPSIGFQIFWLKWHFAFMIQKGYKNENI